METLNKPRRIDLGKLIAIPVFALVMYWNLKGTAVLIRYLFPVNAIKVLLFVNHLLTAGFLVLVIYLYVRRSSAIATTKSFLARFIAVFAFILPFIIPFLGNLANTGPVILAVSNLVMAAGLAFSLAALFALGSSFSIIPQTRRLVVQGPYRLVRHPIYVGEIIQYFGLVLAGVSIPKASVVLLLIACQVYRSIQEEKLLTGTFPEYHDYASKTARFLPGLF
jgi:protein-S-isoprenylcysteine O-methyltransferase Ste14